MNVFEAEIEKYKRRVDRIERNPSTGMLASNKMFYQAFLDHNREMLEWWQSGRPFIGVGGSGMATVVQAFEGVQPLNLVRIADRLSEKRAEEANEKVRAMGLPDYACDRTILFLPLAMAGDDLPKPSVIISHTGACNVVNNTHRTLANLLNVPVFSMEVPFEDPHEQHLGYVAAQIKDMIRFIEDNVPGARFDIDKLREWQKYMRRWYAALHEVYQLRQAVPCPDHPRDAFREPVYPGTFAHPENVVRYYEAYRDELKERAAKKFSPVGEEKMRIVWAITGPYGSGVWDYLAGRGISVPFWQYGQAYRNFALPIYGDTTEFGRKLDPIEEEARTMLFNAWGGTGERWISNTIAACRDFKAEGLVLFEQTGCQPVLGLGQMTMQRAEKELGIPAWCVEGRMLLGHSERTETEFMAGLESYVNLCFERQKQRS